MTPNSPPSQRTQVAVVGAGPAGMFLALQLRAAGIDTVVLEKHTRAYVQGRVRAGVLEPITVDLLARLDLDARLRREGLVHDGVNLALDGEIFRIDIKALTGESVTVYGQQAVMRDLFDAAEARGIEIIWGAQDVALHNLQGDRASISYRSGGVARRLDCDFVGGCDGQHGVCKPAVPSGIREDFVRQYKFGWLGVLAEVPPACDELIYASHARGFALASMRSPSRSRYYLQCASDENPDDWSDARFWDEVCVRLGPSAHVMRGPAIEKSIAPLRGVVSEPMRHGRLFLLGDAAHIVPPTGAKGLNLAASDSILLSEALAEFYAGRPAALDDYSRRALSRVWKAERFSWWFTSITHRFPGADGFAQRMQRAELAYIFESEAARKTLAENYVGLPLTARIIRGGNS